MQYAADALRPSSVPWNSNPRVSGINVKYSSTFNLKSAIRNTQQYSLSAIPKYLPANTDIRHSFLYCAKQLSSKAHWKQLSL